MKFDIVVFNPPYQEEIEGTSDKQIYPAFLDAAYEIADVVETITPGRFLFNAGKTPKEWNKKMLEDEHLKVVEYFPDSRTVFNGVHFAGGVVIAYRNSKEKYKPIKTFIPDNQLRGIFEKIQKDIEENGCVRDIMILQNRFHLDVLFKDYPQYKTYVDSKGEEKERTEKRLVSSSLNGFCIFNKEKDSSTDISILGVENLNQRIVRYVNSKYIQDNGNLYLYKAVVPKSYGTGLKEVGNSAIIGKPQLLEPTVGYTQSFIGLGAFKNKPEAENTLKYLKTKFSRVCLAILKATQDNPPEKWAFVPLQDFTEKSDIDWSKSITEIDQQLYKKYGLTQKEIDFIEEKVRSMDDTV